MSRFAFLLALLLSGLLCFAGCGKSGGESCLKSEECASQACVSSPSGENFCTNLDGAPAANGKKVTGQGPCQTNDDCHGGVCLRDKKTNATYCSQQCSGSCPEGFACGRISSGVSICVAVHSSNNNNNNNNNQTGSVPASLVGLWRLGNVNGEFYNASTGRWGAPNGNLTEYKIDAAGRYEYGNYSRTGTGMCYTKAFLWERGVARAQGSRITFQALEARTRVESVCGTKKVSDKRTVPPPYTYNWRIVSANGGFYLQLSGPKGVVAGPWGLRKIR